MKKCFALLMIAAFAVVWAGGALAEDEKAEAPKEGSIEAIEKAVVEKWDALKSVSATFDLVADVVINQEAGVPMHLIGGGSVDSKKDGEKAKSRLDAWAGMNADFKLAQARIVDDGTTATIETIVMGKSDVKTEDSGVAPGGGALFTELKKHATLSALPDTKVGDEEAYAVAAALNDLGDDVPVSAVNVCFSKKTGIPLKAEIMDKESKAIGTITFSNIKVNHELSDSLFVYSPPAPAAPAKTEEK